ncbi:MAG TPA: hypothetical protein VFT87_05460 [Candidatus Saccharimonadales bacterium]|nr:hypothetical protein [Candidatus Saccharimonadales bacterium]
MKKRPLAFCHSRGFVPTWDMTKRHAQRDGQVATLPHIVAARLATRPPEVSWNNWFTTLSAEYVGLSRQGTKVLIVAHGVGPLTTKDGILMAYSHEFAGNSGQKARRVSMREFRRLEDGYYGSVSVVDLDRYLRKERAFTAPLRRSQALEDVVLHARLGEGAIPYLEYQTAFAQEWHGRQIRKLSPQMPYDNTWLDATMAARSTQLEVRRAMHRGEMQDPHLVQLFMGECSYRSPLQGDEVLAHLLTINRLGVGWVGKTEVLTFGICPQKWLGAFRFVSVPKGAEMAALHPGWNYKEQVARNWSGLMVRLAKPASIGFRELVKLGDILFTVRTQGDISTSREPQFRVAKMRPLSTRSVLLSVHGNDCFAYDLREIRDVAPSGAMGFTFGEIEALKDGAGAVIKYRASVTFYSIVVDTSQQLRRESDVQDDFDTQMRLLYRQ